MKMSHSSIERSLTIIEVSLSIYKKRHGMVVVLCIVPMFMMTNIIFLAFLKGTC